MLYLTGINELSDGKRKITISQQEFMNIFLDLIIKNKAEYNGEAVSFSEKFIGKELKFDNAKEIALEINRKLMSENLKEDIIIDKLVKTLDETEKYFNFLHLKLEELSVITKYSPALDNKALDLIKQYEASIDEYRNKLEKSLEYYLERNANNLSRLVGYKVAARLISVSGGIKEIALSSSSSIQILGAEKAFFRFKKGKGSPPKHGIIYEIPDIYKSPKKLAGKISRTYANGIVKAARADLAGLRSDIPEKTKERVEEIKRKFKYVGYSKNP